MEDDHQTPSPFTKPLLYISGIVQAISDKELAATFQPCLPARFKILRDDNPFAQTHGTVEFSKLENAEKAYAICNDYYFDQHRCTLRLHISEDPSLEPVPNAQIRQVKQLSENTDNATLYSLFRPYGFVHTAKLQFENGRYKGFALVRMFEERDAEQATHELHCLEIDGMMISIGLYTPRSKLTPLPPEFIPASMHHLPPTIENQQTSWSSTANIPGPSSGQFSIPSTIPGMNMGPGSNPAAGLVDPCNLFIKNLDPEISSNDLFNTFRQFGRIVSARVMREEETGNSKGFGFVSFTQSDEASRALNQMNGILLGSKNIIVRLHEPKKVREAKLAQRFGGEGPPIPSAPSKHSKRNSQSYFKAIMAGQQNDLDIESLQALAPPVRKELLSAELSKRVRDLPTVPHDDVSALVDILVELKLQDIVEAIDNPVNLIEKVHDAKEVLTEKRRMGVEDNVTTGVITSALSVMTPTPTTTISASSSTSSPTMATSSSPVPATVFTSVNVPVSTASPTSNGNSSPVVITGTEAERMFAAVKKIDSIQTQDITDLLMALSKPERAKCLFSVDYLRTKILEAQAILDTTADDNPLTNVPAITIPKVSTPASNGTHFDKNLVDPKITAETDKFVDSLLGKPIHEQKQKLGDRLFKVIKSFGMKNAPKITIHLLDTEDLRELAHMMNQPEILKKKVDTITL